MGHYRQCIKEQRHHFANKGPYSQRHDFPGNHVWMWELDYKEGCESESRSVVSDSLRPHGLYSPWISLGQNTGVGNLSLLQGIFPTQGSNLGLPQSGQILYKLKEGWVPKKWCFQTVVLKKTLESPLDCKEINPVNPKGNQAWIFIHWKDWCWSWSSNTLATCCKEQTHYKRPWCWEKLKARGKQSDRRWDGWMASLAQWTWVWENSGR